MEVGGQAGFKVESRSLAEINSVEGKVEVVSDVLRGIIIRVNLALPSISFFLVCCAFSLDL